MHKIEELSKDNFESLEAELSQILVKIEQAKGIRKEIHEKLNLALDKLQTDINSEEGKKLLEFCTRNEARLFKVLEIGVKNTLSILKKDALKKEREIKSN